MTFSNPIVGGTTLIRPAIHSPDYDPGVSGWTINKDGSAEFNNVVIRGGTVVSGIALYYDGTPTAGNLVASISVDGGVDSFGNTYLGGIVTYSGDEFASLNVGNLLLGLIDDSTNAGFVGLSGAGGVGASSPVNGSDPDFATWRLTSGDTSATPTSSTNYPHFEIGAFSGGTTTWVNGAVVRSTVSGGVSTAETWRTPSYSANWAGSTTFGTLSGGLTTLKYRMDAEDNLWLRGSFVASAGAGTTVFQLPAGYRPVSNAPIPVAFISSGGVAGNAWMYVSAAGNLNLNSQLGSAATSGTTYTVNGKIPLGNVG